MGISAHKIRARVKANIGASVNMTEEEVEGRLGSLIKSFRPSANGWSRPQGPTTLGPLRACMWPRIFRSTRVRKATARRTQIIKIRG